MYELLGGITLAVTLTYILIGLIKVNGGFEDE